MGPDVRPPVDRSPGASDGGVLGALDGDVRDDAGAADPGADASTGRPEALGILGLLCLVWGVHWVIMKIGLGYLPPLTYAALRVALAFVVVVVVLARQGRLRRPARLDLPIILSIGLIQVATAIVIQNLALEVVPAGRAALLVYTMPLWVAVLLALAYRTRPRRNEVVGLVLGLIGLFLLLNPGRLDWSDAAALAGALGLLLNAVLWAAVTIHVRHHRWIGTTLELQPWQLLAALIPLTLAALAVDGGGGVDWQPATVLILLYSGALATAFATWAYQAVIRTLGAQTAATSFLAIPVIGLLAGWAILGEALGPADLAGFALVLAGIAATTLGPFTRADAT